uniref:G_PROTEIN_RECEP_F1_2 domain-containing protein n=1 Tax=Steinernema glaseri TaxID=37863 RepID=A0A1I7Y206_9BILA
MSRSYEALMNRLLDATAVIHVPVKLFAILVILRHTPKNMRTLSIFLLNHMIWNFVGNIINSFFHLYPMFPVTCLRMDGIVNYFTDSEDFGHTIYFILFFCMVNCGVAMALTFPYRYIVFVYPNRKFKPIPTVAFCTALHILAPGTVVFSYLQWTVSYDDYPLKKDLPERKSLICFKPSGWENDVTLMTFLALVAVLIIIIVGFAVLLLRSIHKQKGIMHEKLLNKHKRILWNLIIITSVPIFFGGVPLLAVTIYMFKPQLPYATEITTISVVVLANHGTLYALVLIAAIPPYRRAILGFLMKRATVRNAH